MPGHADYWCRSITESGGSSKLLLTEVSICIDKARKVVTDCPAGKATEQGCGDRTELVYILPFSVLLEDALY